MMAIVILLVGFLATCVMLGLVVGAVLSPMFTAAARRRGMSRIEAKMWCKRHRCSPLDFISQTRTMQQRGRL